MIAGSEYKILEYSHLLEETNKPRLFFVIGQEGSGTYMLFNAIDSVRIPPDNAIRRSVPHAHDMPSLKGMIREESLRYDVVPIIIMRGMEATLNSINARDTTRVLMPEDYHWRLHYILWQTDSVKESCRFVIYEEFVTSEVARMAFFDGLGLDYPDGFEFYNANEKYYRET